MNDYITIKNRDDICSFYEKTCGLHDGYITSVIYKNNGIEADETGTSFHFGKDEIKLEILVTSVIGNPTVEILFKGIRSWQMSTNEISYLFGCTIGFDGDSVIWTDGDTVDRERLKDSSYVEALSLEWRFI